MQQQYSTMPTINTQADNEVITVLTKTESRSSDTQKRMYASPNGIAYRFLARDTITSLLDNLNQFNQEHCRGTDSPKSVIVDKLEETIQGIDLDDVVIAINQSRARAA